MSEIRLKTVITKENTQRLSGVNGRSVFSMWGDRLGWGMSLGVPWVESVSHVPLMPRQFLLVSGITLPDSLVLYHSHSCMLSYRRYSISPTQIFYLQASVLSSHHY